MRALARHLLAVLVAVSFLPGVSIAGTSAWIQPGPTIPDVTLKDQDGREWRLRELVESQPVLINFFFTGCSTICPTQILELDIIREKISQRVSKGQAPLFLSISLDPLNDTPDSMKIFAKHLNVQIGKSEHWLMLTGEFSQLSQVWQAFDQLSDSPEKHNSMVWIGQPQSARWTRVNSQGPVESIVSLALEPQS